jgi:hypothetical protein
MSALRVVAMAAILGDPRGTRQPVIDDGPAAPAVR